MNLKVTNLALAFCFFCFTTYSQDNCPTGDLIFTSQDELNQFILDYPDCTQILGKVDVEGNDITSLTSLINIQTVLGGITVINCPTLTSLDGLEALTTARYIAIVDNPSLIVIDDFGNLNSVSQDLEIRDNPNLTMITGMFISTFNGSIRLKRNPKLSDLSAFDNLIEIRGFLELFDLNIEDYDDTYFPNLTTIGERLSIFNNEEGAPALLGISGFNTLTAVKANLDIDCDRLESLSGFQNLIEAGGLEYDGSSNITNITGFGKLQRLTVNPNISSTGKLSMSADNLENLDFLSTLKYIDGNKIDLSNNLKLKSIKGLRNVESILSFAMIINSPLLQECQIASICQYFGSDAFNPNSPLAPFAIKNNGEGCQTVDELLSHCTIDTTALDLELCPGAELIVADTTLTDFGYFEYATADCFGLDSVLQITIKESDFEVCDGCSNQSPTLRLQVQMSKSGQYSIIKHSDSQRITLREDITKQQSIDYLYQYNSDQNQYKIRQHQNEISRLGFESLINKLQPNQSVSL